MGTKRQPGAWDCYDRAHPDEPIFTLRANDPLASAIVDAWAGLYALRVNHDPDKVDEARACAESMRRWYNANHPTVEVWK